MARERGKGSWQVQGVLLSSLLLLPFLLATF